jgi:hypothetical protein
LSAILADFFANGQRGGFRAFQETFLTQKWGFWVKRIKKLKKGDRLRSPFFNQNPELTWYNPIECRLFSP